MAAPHTQPPRSERVLRAKTAAHTRWANTDDRTAATRPGRSAFMRQFEDQVDPDRKLDPAERARRAESARKAYMTGLSLKSAVARRKAREEARRAKGAGDG